MAIRSALRSSAGSDPTKEYILLIFSSRAWLGVVSGEPGRSR